MCYICNNNGALSIHILPLKYKIHLPWRQKPGEYFKINLRDVLCFYNSQAIALSGPLYWIYGFRRLSCSASYMTLSSSQNNSTRTFVISFNICFCLPGASSGLSLVVSNIMYNFVVKEFDEKRSFHCLLGWKSAYLPSGFANTIWTINCLVRRRKQKD